MNKQVNKPILSQQSPCHLLTITTWHPPRSLYLPFAPEDAKRSANSGQCLALTRTWVCAEQLRAGFVVSEVDIKVGIQRDLSSHPTALVSHRAPVLQDSPSKNPFAPRWAQGMEQCLLQLLVPQVCTRI